MEDILLQLAETARGRVQQKEAALPLGVVRERAEALTKAERTRCAERFPFETALKGPDIAFICECKKASPSKDLIAPNFPYVSIARDYESAGAAAVSVLTEPTRFLGSDDYLREIAAAVRIPCLRKDFTVDEYMIFEAKALGAKAVLLIVSLLDRSTLGRYIALCDSLNLSSLVEAHDEDQISAALDAGARVVGVNNRDLRTFHVDVHRAERMRPLVPQSVVYVAESGIRTAADVQVLRDAGVDACLIGEQLMRAPDKRAELTRLRGL